LKNYLRFKEEFEDDLFPVLKKTVGIGLILIFILVPVFSWVDYYYYPEYFYKFLYYRIGAAILAAFLFYINLKSQKFRTSKIIGILGYYVVGMCIIMMIKDVDGFETPYYAGLLLVFTGFISIVPLEMKCHFFHVSILYAIYMTTVFLSEDGQISRLFWVNNIFLLSCLAILLTASFFNYRKRFEEFIGRKKLMKAEECLRQYANRLRENVKESESRYASVVNNAKEGILILSNRKVTFCNPRANEILTSLKVIDRDEEILEQLPPKMQETIIDAYNKAVTLGKSTINQEMELEEDKFSKRWFEYTVVPIEIHKEPASVLFLRDISAKKQMENELIQSQKMEAIGVMAGGVAHDLNNVFQIVSGYVQMGLQQTKRESKIHYYLRQIEKTIARASMVARQLLIFARKDESKKEILDVNSQIVSLTKLLHRVIPKMITIDLRLSADAGFIYADPVKFEQVLLNLCINARDAMPDGGMLEISTSKTNRLPNDIKEFSQGLCDNLRQEYVCIKIVDTGHGIPPEVKDKIFEPFFTTKEKGKGTGLGLSIVYGIVKDHQGFICCDSQPGVGTAFSVYLPCCQNPQEQDRKDGSEFESVSTGNELILLVDDEEQIRDIGKNMLEQAGYRVETVESAEAAIKFIKEQGDSLSLILLDLNMPGMGGIKFLEQFNEIFPGLKVAIIICTGYFDREDLSKVQNLGVSHIINKPFKFSEIVPVIRSVLSSHTKK